MNQQTITALEELFAFVPPDELRRSITKIHYSYLIHTEVLPQDYKKTVENVWFLVDFLEKVGKGR
jgi:hypothetical protein